MNDKAVLGHDKLVVGNDKLIVGNLELADLPEMGIIGLQIRIDTGAKTSSLHVDNLRRFNKNGKPWVRFDIHPDVHNVEDLIQCESPLHDVRRVKSSNGQAEERYVINTLFRLGQQQWLIEITLTNRADMTNLMLLGREAMGERLLVDPSKTFMVSSSSDQNLV